ncbi:MAG: hypothetical protein QOH81_2411 [Sphingomonadales bacterium]|jgi:hypothetical protein|nr:hypothetical protein [Sphingomonadales bacterium]
MTNIIKGLSLAAICLSVAGCKVQKTQDAQLPTVEVNASGGQLPEYNIQGPNVTIGTENKTIQVPTVNVSTPSDKPK